MPVDLEALTQGLFSACDAYLGDSVTITPPGGAPITLKAHASAGDTRIDFGLSASTVQNASIDVDKAALPGKPGKGWTVTLAPIPGMIFEPKATESDDSGRRWTFGLKELGNG